MVDQPNNFQSIVGGIFRGLSNDKRSVGLTGSNVKTDNPHTYAWIGQETSDLRQPIEKEQSQNPSLPFAKGSSGTQYSYTQPLPTDVRTLIAQGSPGTNIALTDEASSIGSMIQTVPAQVPMNNWNFSGYGMSPQNGDHFKLYFANQLGVRNMNPTPMASQVLTAVQEQQNTNTDGSSNVWHGSWQTIQSMRKGYRPANQFIQGMRHS
jgi:hypothetical protein